MTRKFVVRDDGPPEDPPTELWLEMDADGDVRIMARRAGETDAMIAFVSSDSGMLRLCWHTEERMAALGLARDFAEGTWKVVA